MKFFLLLTICFTLSACASIVTGQNQSISVETHPVPGAECKLTNDKGTWFVTNTPGSVIVRRAYGDLSVICNKGNYNGTQTVKSYTKGMAAGNILFGGLIGGAVDAGTGAAYDYPTLVTVPMYAIKK